MPAPSFTLMLDFDGVVMFDMHHNPKYRCDWKENIEQDLKINREDVNQAIFQNPNYRAVQMGQVDILDFLGAVLPTIGYTGSAQSFVDYWIPRTSKPENLNHDFLNYIQYLRQEYEIKVYVPTVQNRFRRSYLHNEMGIDHYFDGFFYASDLGFFKDDPKFYKAIENKLGINTPQDPILFFDDRPHFVQAAQNAGWEAVIYNTLDDFNNHPWIFPLIETMGTQVACTP